MTEASDVQSDRWHAPWCDPAQHRLVDEAEPDVPHGCVGHSLVARAGDVGGWWAEQGFIVDIEPDLAVRWKDSGLSHEDLHAMIGLFQRALGERP